MDWSDSLHPETRAPLIALLEEINSDIIVGADGSKSLVRDVVLEEQQKVKPAGMTLYLGTIDAERVKEDAELRPYAEADGVSLNMVALLVRRS